MDFLFEADKKNRRRVELENFILLLLRCLAMLLLALMLARPFLPNSITSLLQNKRQLERVLVIDNSLSQQVRYEARTSLEATRESVKELIARWAESDETEDWLTVFVTSDPENPVLANDPVTMNTLSILNEAIDGIPESDGSADYPASLSSVLRYTSSQREEGGRAVYFYSDMRRLDWETNAQSDPERAPNKLISQVAEAVDGCFVVDTGSPNDDNLAVVSIRPENLLVAGKTIPFVVKVANYGSAPAQNIRVLMQVDESQPEYLTLPSLGAGETREVTFRYVFPKSDNQQDNLLEATQIPAAAAVRNYRVRAEIDRQSLTDVAIAKDQLLDDSVAFYAARVSDGISVLLVDGDPSSVSERSETHYLKSLEVPGSGLISQVITATELETISLSDFQVIFLCNVDEVSADRTRSLQRWVEEGGALVLMPGNRVRAQRFNDTFYQNGSGLSPLALDTIEGDPTMSQWVNFEIDPQLHPALEVVVDSDAASLSNVDIFSWWTSQLPEQTIGKTVSVPLRLTDERNSVAMADRTLGSGNVIVFAIPGDGDWSMWPISPTFPPVFIELIDYLVGSTAESSTLTMGGGIDYQVDITAFDNRVILRDPQNEKVEAVAAPIGDSSGTDDSVLYEVKFDNVDRRGFYELQLKRHSGETESVLFAANVDADEGRLLRLGREATEGDFFGDDVSLMDPEKLVEQTVSGGNSEIWLPLLMVLFGILMAEQFLAWYWGKKR